MAATVAAGLLKNSALLEPWFSNRLLLFINAVPVSECAMVSHIEEAAISNIVVIVAQHCLHSMLLDFGDDGAATLASYSDRAMPLIDALRFLTLTCPQPQVALSEKTLRLAMTVSLTEMELMQHSLNPNIVDEPDGNSEAVLSLLVDLVSEQNSVACLLTLEYIRLNWALHCGLVIDPILDALSLDASVFRRSDIDRGLVTEPIFETPLSELISPNMFKSTNQCADSFGINSNTQTQHSTDVSLTQQRRLRIVLSEEMQIKRGALASTERAPPEPVKHQADVELSHLLSPVWEEAADAMDFDTEEHSAPNRALQSTTKNVDFVQPHVMSTIVSDIALNVVPVTIMPTAIILTNMPPAINSTNMPTAINSTNVALLQSPRLILRSMPRSAFKSATPIFGHAAVVTDQSRRPNKKLRFCNPISEILHTQSTHAMTNPPESSTVRLLTLASPKRSHVVALPKSKSTLPPPSSVSASLSVFQYPITTPRQHDVLVARNDRSVYKINANIVDTTPNLADLSLKSVHPGNPSTRCAAGSISCMVHSDSLWGASEPAKIQSSFVASKVDCFLPSKVVVEKRLKCSHCGFRHPLLKACGCSGDSLRARKPRPLSAISSVATSSITDNTALHQPLPQPLRAQPHPQVHPPESPSQQTNQLTSAYNSSTLGTITPAPIFISPTPEQASAPFIRRFASRLMTPTPVLLSRSIASTTPAKASISPTQLAGSITTTTSSLHTSGREATSAANYEGFSLLTKMRFEICDWLVAIGMPLPLVDLRRVSIPSETDAIWPWDLDAVAEIFSSGVILFTLHRLLTREFLSGLIQHPRSQAAALTNLQRVMDGFRRYPSVAITYLNSTAAAAIQRAHVGTIFSLLIDIQRGFQSECNHWSLLKRHISKNIPHIIAATPLIESPRTTPSNETIDKQAATSLEAVNILVPISTLPLSRMPHGTLKTPHKKNTPLSAPVLVTPSHFVYVPCEGASVTNAPKTSAIVVNSTPERSVRTASVIHPHPSPALRIPSPMGPSIISQSPVATFTEDRLVDVWKSTGPNAPVVSGSATFAASRKISVPSSGRYSAQQSPPVVQDSETRGVVRENDLSINASVMVPVALGRTCALGVGLFDDDEWSRQSVPMDVLDCEVLLRRWLGSLPIVDPRYPMLLPPPSNAVVERSKRTDVASSSSLSWPLSSLPSRRRSPIPQQLPTNNLAIISPSVSATPLISPPAALAYSRRDPRATSTVSSVSVLDDVLRNGCVLVQVATLVYRRLVQLHRVGLVLTQRSEDRNSRMAAALARSLVPNPETDDIDRLSGSPSIEVPRRRSMTTTTILGPLSNIVTLPPRASVVSYEPISLTDASWTCDADLPSPPDRDVPDTMQRLISQLSPQHAQLLKSGINGVVNCFLSDATVRKRMARAETWSAMQWKPKSLEDARSSIMSALEIFTALSLQLRSTMDTSPSIIKFSVNDFIERVLHGDLSVLWWCLYGIVRQLPPLQTSSWCALLQPILNMRNEIQLPMTAAPIVVRLWPPSPSKTMLAEKPKQSVLPTRFQANLQHRFIRCVERCVLLWINAHLVTNNSTGFSQAQTRLSTLSDLLPRLCDGRLLCELAAVVLGQRALEYRPTTQRREQIRVAQQKQIQCVSADQEFVPDYIVRKSNINVLDQLTANMGDGSGSVLTVDGRLRGVNFYPRTRAVCVANIALAMHALQRKPQQMATTFLWCPDRVFEQNRSYVVGFLYDLMRCHLQLRPHLRPQPTLDLAQSCYYEFASEEACELELNKLEAMFPNIDIGLSSLPVSGTSTPIPWTPSATSSTVTSRSNSPSPSTCLNLTSAQLGSKTMPNSLISTSGSGAAFLARVNQTKRTIAMTADIAADDHKRGFRSVVSIHSIAPVEPSVVSTFQPILVQSVTPPTATSRRNTDIFPHNISQSSFEPDLESASDLPPLSTTRRADLLPRQVLASPNSKSAAVSTRYLSAESPSSTEASIRATSLTRARSAATRNAQALLNGTAELGGCLNNSDDGSGTDIGYGRGLGSAASDMFRTSPRSTALLARQRQRDQQHVCDRLTPSDGCISGLCGTWTSPRPAYGVSGPQGTLFTSTKNITVLVGHARTPEIFPSANSSQSCNAADNCDATTAICSSLAHTSDSISHQSPGEMFAHVSGRVRRVSGVISKVAVSNRVMPTRNREVLSSVVSGQVMNLAELDSAPEKPTTKTVLLESVLVSPFSKPAFELDFTLSEQAPNSTNESRFVAADKYFIESAEPLARPEIPRPSCVQTPVPQ